MAAAEAVLVMHLRDAPHALLAGQHILESSSLLEARFHAAVGLKRATMLRWESLSVEEVSSCIRACSLPFACVLSLLCSSMVALRGARVSELYSLSTAACLTT